LKNITGLKPAIVEKRWLAVFVVICGLGLDQLCPTQMAYWAKKYVTISTRAEHWI